MRRTRTESITFGAMMCALLGVLLFFNRQMAGALDAYLFWIVPLGMIVYCVRYSMNNALVVAVSMLIIAFVVAGPVSLFYVFFSVVAGLIYSYGLQKKWSGLMLIFAVFAVSAVINILSVFVFSAVFGYDVAAEIQFIRDYFDQAMKAANIDPALVPIFHNNRLLMTIFAISLILSSLLEGVLVHLLAFLILKRLKMEVPPMKPVGDIYCPKWLKVYVFGVFFALIMGAVTGITQYYEIIIPLGIIAYLVCIFFGYLYVLMLLAVYVPDTRKRALLIIPVVVIGFITQTLLMIGLLDIFTGTRRRILQEVRKRGQ